LSRRPQARLRGALWIAFLSCLVLGLPSAHALTVRCADPQAQLGEWPMFGRSINSDRFQVHEHGLSDGAAAVLAPIWTFDANRVTHESNNEVTSYPIEKDGCVFVGSSTGNNADGSHRPGWIFALNAENGDPVWATKVPGGVYSTVAVDRGVVYAFVSRISSPLVVALDEFSGRVLWQTVVDLQFGSDAVSSPVVYDGLLWVGVSGTAAEGSSSARTAFQGSTVLLATRELTAPSFHPVTAARAHGVRRFRPGEIVRKLWSVPQSQWSKGFAGGAQWGTIAIDPSTGYGYEGTGNPFNYDSESPRTNAVLKIDLNRRRSTFGQVVGSYKGNVEYQVAEAAGLVPCAQIEQIAGSPGIGLECARLDLDFGATPNIVKDAGGRKMLVVGQKSGVVHFIDANTMKGIRTVRLGVDSPVGGMVGSGATDGKTIYGTHTIGGYLYAIGRDGTPKWVTPTADGVHWGPPVTLANGVIYTVDLKGFLDGYLALTGTPILHRPLQLQGITTGGLDPGNPNPSVTVTQEPATITNPPFSWGGVTIARGTVFVSVGVGLTSAGLPSMPDGFVIAFRPSLPVQ
jgi:polyvinyl alcohol dehydrogenase (cytochrome)